MFDLFRSREKTVRYILTGLLSLVALSMVITLIPGFGSGPAVQDDVLAEIGDYKITAREARSLIQRAVTDRQISSDMLPFYAPTIIQQMISERALVYQAKRMGFQVEDKEVAEGIFPMAQQFYENGKLNGEAYKAFIEQRVGMSMAEFENSIRVQLFQKRMLDLLTESTMVTPREVEDQYRKKNEKIKVAYAVFKQEDLRGKTAVTPAEIDEFWKKTSVNYRIPEARKMVLYVVDSGKLGENIKLDEARIRQAYQSQLDRFRVAERVSSRHILLKTLDLPADKVEALRKKAEDLLKQAKSGADFAELAKKNSEDTGSAVRGGDLGFRGRGEFVKEFEDAAFSLRPGQFSNVVKTQYGFHVIKLDAREEARLKPFEEVRGEIETEMRRDQAEGQVQRAAEQIRLALVKSEGEAAKTAATFGITPIQVDRASRMDPIQEIGVSGEFDEAVQTLPKNGVSRLTDINGKFAVARVLDVIPARPAALNEVEVKVREAALTDKINRLFNERMKEVEAKLKAGGDAAAIAKQFGVEVKTSEPFARDGQVGDVGSGMQFREVYDLAVGASFGPINTGPTFFAGKLLEKIPPDLKQFAEQRLAIQDALKRRIANERKDLFMDGVVNQLIQEKKLKRYEDNIKRFTNSYRGA